jgi:hypothetical protein
MSPLGDERNTPLDDAVSFGSGKVLIGKENLSLFLDTVGDGIEGGCLAGSVGTDQSNDGFVLDVDIDATHCGDDAIIDFKIGNFKHV